MQGNSVPPAEAQGFLREHQDIKDGLKAMKEERKRLERKLMKATRKKETEKEKDFQNQLDQLQISIDNKYMALSEAETFFKTKGITYDAYEGEGDEDSDDEVMYDRSAKVEKPPEVRVKVEDENSDSLFVDSKTSAEKPGNTHLTVGTKSKSIERDLPSLLDCNSARQAKDFKCRTVGWMGGRAMKYINMYGPRDRPIHRIESLAADESFDTNLSQSDNVSNARNRCGEQTDQNGKRIFTKYHIKDICGVAWAGADGTEFEEDLDLIDPDIFRKRYPHTYILVRWQRNNEITECWETRGTLRVRWGAKNADKKIFQAAKLAEERFQKREKGSIDRKSRSPSVSLLTQEKKKNSPGPSSMTRGSAKKATDAILSEYCQENDCDLDEVNLTGDELKELIMKLLSK